MNLGLKPWQKIVLSITCFSIAIFCFIIKLPAAFRGFDKELHAAFYFCAAAFLNILFAKRNIIIHAVIFGGLYLFGMAIEHGQVLSKKLWKIPHGRYDPEDVKGNLNGLMLFSAIWLLYIAVYYVRKQYNNSQQSNAAFTDTEELLYQNGGKFFLMDYSPENNELVIRSRNKTDASNIFNVDLFFKDVQHIQLPTKMEDIKIYKVARMHEAELKTNSYNRKTIFRIKDRNGNLAFIDAGSFMVFHNELAASASSLGSFTWTENNRQVYSTNNEAL